MHLEDDNPLFYLLNLHQNDAFTNGTSHMAGSDAVLHNDSCSLP
jgi:hypothetical protein